MKARTHLTILAALACVLLARPSFAQEGEKPMLTHTHNEFVITVQAPIEKAFPLFGAIEEKKWAEGWEPQVVYPSPAKDQQGMVFRVAHNHMSSVWTCTAFDSSSGHVQYVYVVADAMVTLIDIHLSKAGASETKVSVVYERTALASEANDHVVHLAKNDAKSAPEWEQAINGYLAKAAK